MKYINFFLQQQMKLLLGDVHIHLVILGTERYNEFIILKNYLLQNKEEASKYSSFKIEIINKGITDRKEYKVTKSEYVSKLLMRAKKWYNNE